jgi:hypothetical protein
MAKKKDTNELAKFIVGIATGETPSPEENTKNPAAVALGRLGGLKGERQGQANSPLKRGLRLQRKPLRKDGRIKTSPKV